MAGVGGKPNAGYSFYQDTGSSAVSSVRYRNSTRQMIVVVSCSLAPLTSLLVPSRGFMAL